MTLRKKVLYSIIALGSILLIDRFFFMESRLDGGWEFERGTYLGDPVVYKQHFSVKGTQLSFYKDGRRDTLCLVGCYFGELLMYDFTQKRITRYKKY